MPYEYDGLNEFEADLHREVFKDYLELVIDRHGNIVYATPTHEWVMEWLYRGEFGSEPRNDFEKAEASDYFGFLMEKVGAVCVWLEGYEGDPNEEQEKSLAWLCDQGFFKT